jgi:uncharacterized membrane-anchored protein
MKVVHHLKVAVLRYAVPVILSIASLCSQVSQAQQTPSFQLPAAVNPVQWTVGPSQPKLGDVAQINIPDGFQFLDAKGARYVLEGMHNPVPPNLVGILAPSSTKWFAVIKFTGLGYVKDTDSAKLDPALMLGKIRTLLARQNVPVSSLDWEIKPSYDPAQSKLEWAIRAVTSGNDATVNYSVQLFGRRGVMEVVAVQPQADFDAAPLREMTKNISFQNGERYSDYQAGDKVAPSTLAQMSNYLSGPDSAGRVGHKTLWIGVGSGILLLAGAGFAVTGLLRRRRSVALRKDTAARPLPRQPVPASQPAEVSTMAQAPVASVTKIAPMSTREGGTSPQPTPDRNRPVSVPKNGGRKRRKQYNFHLFYSDMIMNLTRWHYMGGFGTYVSDYSHGLSNGNGSGADHNGTIETGLPDGTPARNHSINGNPPNGTNGNHTNISTANNSLPPDAARLLATETAKLIENQQKLIEGQRKLIEEQSKLIREKSKLIDLENSVLGKQSELIGEQELL